MKNATNNSKSLNFSARNRRFAALLISALMITSALGFALVTPQTQAQAAGNVTDFFVTAQPVLNGMSFNVFSPQSLVVQESNQVNITIRNVGNQTFHLQIQGQPAVTVQAGTQNGSIVTPVDTPVPVFTASTAGIFTFNSVEQPAMNGQLVVIPTDWASYNPTAQARSFTQLIIPDFAGDGYDKYFPATMVVNRGDTVNLTVTNTDDMPHGFALAAYGLDVVINPGQDLPNGSIQPQDTSIQPFIASAPGIFEFLCTVPCGPGHLEMVGSLVVLPNENSGSYNPEPVTQYSYITIQPDVAGPGYDKFLPDIIFANQNDLVYIKVRNTDTELQGFSLPNYSINNIDIAPATGNTTTGLVVTDTFIPEFYANQPGIFEFFCSNDSINGYQQMIGYLVVLPSFNSTSTVAPATTATAQPMSTAIFVGLTIALLLVGILIGVVVVTRFAKEATEETQT